MDMTPIYDERPEPEHSPKGGSSAERWMNCSGSAALLRELRFPETDEPEYRALGIAAHEAGEHCLKNGCDTWEIVGSKFHDQEVDGVMADAVQMYLDYVRPLLREPSNSCLIEERIGSDPEKRPHPDFYGTVDFSSYGTEWLEIVDYKHGEGIVVDPENNVQLMYYAYGVIWERMNRPRPVNVRSDRPVRLTIVQPRAFHEDGPIRSWETTAGEIIHWGEHVLIPAMQAAEMDNEFNAGQWCRFCPAKLFCPQLSAVFGAAMKADPKALPSFSAKRLGLEYEGLEAVRFYQKAVEEEIYRRNIIGHTVPGTKLVQKQAKRVFREGAEKLFQDRLGDQAFAPRELRSPAQMEEVSPEAKKLVKEWAYTPNTGLTVALESSRKPAVKVEKSADTFAHLIPADSDGEQHDDQ